MGRTLSSLVSNYSNRLLPAAIALHALPQTIISTLPVQQHDTAILLLFLGVRFRRPMRLQRLNVVAALRRAGMLDE